MMTAHSLQNDTHCQPWNKQYCINISDVLLAAISGVYTFQPPWQSDHMQLRTLQHIHNLEVKQKLKAISLWDPCGNE